MGDEAEERRRVEYLVARGDAAYAEALAQGYSEAGAWEAACVEIRQCRVPWLATEEILCPGDR